MHQDTHSNGNNSGNIGGGGINSGNIGGGINSGIIRKSAVKVKGEGLLSRIAQSFIFRLLMSLFLAVFVWLLLNASVINPPTEGSQLVTLRVLNRAALDGRNMELDEDVQIPANIRVFYKGRAEDLSNITASNFEAVVDFTGVTGVDVKSLPIELRSTDADNVSVMRYEPSSVTIEVERRRTKLFNIDVVFAGDTADGFLRTGYTQYPFTKTYTDRESEIEKIDRVEAVVDLTGLAGNTVFHPMCVIYDHDGNEINRVGWEQVVDVTVEVSKEVPIIPNVVVNPANDYYERYRAITPETVRINGTAQSLEKVDNLYTELLSIESARSTVKQELPLVIPNNVKISMSDKASAEVEVTIEKYQYTQDIVLNKAHVEFINGNANYRYEIVENEKPLTLRARADDLANLTPDMISAVVNVAGLYPGTYAVEAIVSLPERIVSVNNVILTVVVASAYNGTGTGGYGGGAGGNGGSGGAGGGTDGTGGTGGGAATESATNAEGEDSPGEDSPGDDGTDDLTDPSAADGVSEPSEPDDLGEPEGPSDPSDPSESSDPGDTGVPDNTDNPGETGNPGNTGNTGNTENTDGTTDLGTQSDTSAQSAQSESSASNTP